MGLFTKNSFGGKKYSIIASHNSFRKLSFFGKLRMRFIAWRYKQKRKRQAKKAMKNGYRPLQEF